MSEPPKDRDKAVEEALMLVKEHARDAIQCGQGSYGWAKAYQVLSLLWQQAQEAPDGPWFLQARTNEATAERYKRERDEARRAQEAEREECARVIERAEVGQFPRVILAEMIRNRSAARAPEEPKP